MRPAETVLNVIRERGERGLPLENIYRLLYNRELYLRAYGRLYSNQGAMTKGTTAETVDGMSLAKSTAVFMGQVVSVREFDRGNDIMSSSDPTTVEFDVQAVWKGPSSTTMFLTTARFGASCGFTFVKGEKYVVYSQDGSTVSLCSRTRPLSAATHDLAALGKGQVPAQGTTTPTPDVSEYQTGGGCGLSPHTTDLSVVGLMVGIAWLGLRKQRSDTR